MPQQTSASAQIKPRRAGRPTAQDQARIDRRIIQAARECFIAKGYGATSTNEVARAARVAKVTLYSRFPTKGDLLKALIDEQIRRTGGEIRHVGPKPKSLETMLRIFAEQSLKDSLSSETLPLNRIIYSESERFPELGEVARSRAQTGIQQISRYIRDFAIKDQIPCRDPDFVAEMFTSVTRGWYFDMMLRKEPVTDGEIRSWTQRMTKWFVANRPNW